MIHTRCQESVWTRSRVLVRGRVANLGRFLAALGMTVGGRNNVPMRTMFGRRGEFAKWATAKGTISSAAAIFCGVAAEAETDAGAGVFRWKSDGGEDVGRLDGPG
jgi:hypothetical protein